MATGVADLEARVQVLESRTDRNEEDITAIITTVVETRDDVKLLKRGQKRLRQDVDILKQDMGWLRRAVEVLLSHSGLRVEPVESDPDDA